MLSKRSQPTKNTHCIISFMQNSERCKLVESDIRQVSGHLGKDGWEGREGRVTEVCKDILGDEYVYFLDYGDGFTRACIRQNLPNYIPFKYVQFLACKLYFIKLFLRLFKKSK